jgi:hypothetical protein
MELILFKVADDLDGQYAHMHSGNSFPQVLGEQRRPASRQPERIWAQFCERVI